ncbi:hypothetical protein PMSD_13030 [Paenibacillus macquariensis subsp. defensor]|nr:hypothetical protein PMSD_13030 [Paenibacillus macquariensis subsp. defensor]
MLVKKRSRTPHGNPHIKSVLAECDWVASRSKRTYLATKYWKLAARRGKNNALIAVAHKMLIIYNMLLRQQPYIDLGEDYLDNISSEIKVKHLLRQLESLGYDVQVTSQTDAS